MVRNKAGAAVLAAVAATLVFGVGGASAAASGEAGGPPAAQQGPSWDTFHRTELYFGSEKPTGGEVTPEEFENFVDKELTPAFPDGLTTLTARGQWQRGPGNVIKETTYVVVLFYPVTDREADGEIEEVRAGYRRLFDQDSVARVDDVQRVSF